jgi:hypothetical protein
MSLIFNCEVTSQPAWIRFRWHGNVELDATTNFDFDASTVRDLDSGKETPLSGWKCDRIELVSAGSRSAAGKATGRGHAGKGSDATPSVYDVEMTPTAATGAGTSGPRSKFTPESGHALELHFTPKDPQGAAHPHGDTTAIVDYPGGSVPGAIHAAADRLAAQMSTGINQATEGLASQMTTGFSQVGQDLNAQVKSGTEEANRDFRLLTAFPFQVSDGVAPVSAETGSGGAVSSAAALVNAEMRAVLGRVPGRGGVTATLAALDRSFSLDIVDGVETWVPQKPYAVQSDIGAGVTGEQASLARLAAMVNNEILPLVTDLQPLIVDANVPVDELEAARSIFVNTLPLFSAEVARDGGPRVTRARTLLTDATRQLLTLGTLLGMYPSGSGDSGAKLTPTGGLPTPSRANVITGDDEQAFTNFVIVANRLTLLVDQFNVLYPAPAGAGSGAISSLPVDRGRLLVILQRALDATEEATDSVFAALDSVYLGEDERDLIGLVPEDPNTDSLQDALDLAAQFHLEATELLQDAGTVGAVSIESRATDIQSAVELASMMRRPESTPWPTSWPLGLKHPRVQTATDILLDRFDDVREFACDVAKTSDPNVPCGSSTTPASTAQPGPPVSTGTKN